VIYSPDILDKLQAIEAVSWSGLVYRHMINDYPPERANTRGARWNPPGVAAVYTSLAREVALAEAEYRLGLEPFRPRVTRKIYSIRVRLRSTVDLGSRADLEALGVLDEDLSSIDHTACQHLGGAVAWLGNDGLLVPSARAAGTNLVIFQTHLDESSEFQVISEEQL
jgi:RES domain-containing protein